MIRSLDFICRHDEASQSGKLVNCEQIRDKSADSCGGHNDPHSHHRENDLGLSATTSGEDCESERNPANDWRYGTWGGLAPDDSPLVLRDVGTQEIYALDLHFRDFIQPSRPRTQTSRAERSQTRVREAAVTRL
jgi:hypothetical protein